MAEPRRSVSVAVPG